MAVHMMLLEKNPSFRARQFRLEQDFTRRRSAGVSLDKLKVVTVGVVVNVVYQTSAQNISEAQVRSQIDVLNRDFGAKNPDKAKVPTPWKGLVTDSRIRFKLTGDQAHQDDKDVVHVRRRGQEGIDRRNRAQEPREVPEPVGVPLGGGLLGYAQFPKDPRRPTAS